MQTKRNHIPNCLPCQVPGPWVIAPQNRHILFLLQAQDVGLGGGISRHAAMPVKVIGRNIQDRRHFQRACRILDACPILDAGRILDGGRIKDGGHDLKLKARKLHHHQVIRPDLVQHRNQRRANVAAHPHPAPSGEGRGERHGRHPSHQASGGGFSRGAGDANRPAGAGFQKYLRVVRERDAAPPRLNHQRQAERHAARGADQVGGGQYFEWVPTADPLDLLFQQGQRGALGR